MKITRKQLRRLIKEELSNLSEAGVPKGLGLDRWIRNPERNIKGKIPPGALRHDWYSSGQAGPYYDKSEFYEELRDYPKIIGYVDPDPESESYGEDVMITVMSPDDMDDILDPILRRHPGLQYSID